MATMVANSRGCAVATTMRRVCDVCTTRSALWYCAADEGYLCTPCDTQVHAANAVSLRHERVRLAPSGTVPKKLPVSSQQHEVPSEDAAASSRKRPSSQPYSHHLRKLTRLSNQLVEDKHSQAELQLFDFLDADSEFFLDDGNQEVPSLPGVTESSSPTCSSRGSDDLECVVDRDGDHSADSTLAAFFKGKAALHSQTFDHFDDQCRLVPDDAALFDQFDVPADDLAAAGDGFFFPGDIPGLESFVPEMDLVDDFSLSFDLALQNHGLNAFEGNNNINEGADVTGAAECKTKPTDTTTTALHRDYLAGPFAKFFAQKSKMTDSEVPMDPERIKREARAMLLCCNGEDEVASVPSLQLNVKDVLAAWSEREEPWIVCCDDAGLVPDLDGDRDARVLRYKEKRRTRLFSKTIRYEVRKLNAERRPRMKGRFVKRTTTPTTTTTTTTATICF